MQSIVEAIYMLTFRPALNNHISDLQLAYFVEEEMG